VRERRILEMVSQPYVSVKLEEGVSGFSRTPAVARMRFVGQCRAITGGIDPNLKESTNDEQVVRS
jgi:hypothetical protein